MVTTMITVTDMSGIRVVMRSPKPKDMGTTTGIRTATVERKRKPRTCTPTVRMRIDMTLIPSTSSLFVRKRLGERGLL
jgi:hypothetical protein